MLPVVQLTGHNGQVPEAKIILGPKIGQNLDSPPSYVTAMQGSEQAPPPNYDTAMQENCLKL